MKSEFSPIYRIVFLQQEDIKEIYAQYISEETLVGFIEADTLIDYDPAKAIVNTSEVRRCYIPLHTILRIDEVMPDNLLQKSSDNSNVSHLPHAFKKTDTAKK